MIDSGSSNFGTDVCAVVVTYHPDEDIVDNIRTISSGCSRVVVVDNGSAPDLLQLVEQIPKVEVVMLGRNHGLAFALNYGVARAEERGHLWVITFDQDSRPKPGMISAIWSTHLAHPSAALIGPRIQEQNSEVSNYRWVCRDQIWPFLFRRRGLDKGDLEGVTMMVTSGSMLNVSVWRELGRFDDGLFIDYIDTDFCLRVLKSGRKIAVSGEAILEHRLGARERRVFAGKVVRPTHHAPFRHYYMARNRVLMWRRHALDAPHWAAFDFCFAGFNTFRIFLFEHHRWEKAKAILRGTWDGFLGKRGRMPS